MEKKRNTKQDKQNKRKKAAVVLTILALLTILVGTFAWTAYTEWVKNHMQSQGFEPGKVTIIEEFDPQPIDVNPKIKKVVNVANTSSADAFVRISFEEMLHKLSTGAAKDVFETQDASKFPVIFNASEYLKKGASFGEVVGNGGYTLENDANVKLSDGSALPAGVKLFVKGTGKDAEGVIVNLREMTADEFPDDFDFEAHGITFPIIDGSWTKGSKALVAQKMQGKPVKKTDGSFVIYKKGDLATSPGLGIDDAFGYFGYGVDVGTAVEADWAGENVAVSQAVSIPKATNYNVSAIANSGIKFAMSNTTANDIKIGAGLSAWEYNAKDGYFYYTEVLKAGVTTSVSVLQEVQFPEVKNDVTYKVASYNLWVGLEAIPATKSALIAESKGGILTKGDGPKEKPGATVYSETNNAGWGLDPTANKDLYDYFQSKATIIE